MAITKQTAKRSTGGKAPRAALANLAARNPRVLRAPDVGVDEWTLHRWIMFAGATVNPWVYQPANQALLPVPFAEGYGQYPIISGHGAEQILKFFSARSSAIGWD
jgi:hypothetical protein